MGRRLSSISSRFFRLIFLLLLLQLSSSCTLADKSLRGTEASSPAHAKTNDAPRINSFLALKDSHSPAVRLEIEKLEALVDDLWLPLIQGRLVVDSTILDDTQMLLGGVEVQPGRCQQLRINIVRAQLQQVTGEWKELLTEAQSLDIVLGDSLNLEADDSRTLLLTWDVQGSLTAERGFSPVISAAPAVRQLPINLVYVSCPNINTVFILRTDTNRVVDSFGLKGGPTWLALDPEETGNRLYVLTPADRMVKVIDLSTYRIVDFFPVPLNDIPSFMTIDPNGGAAFLLDEKSGYLSRMDLTSGRITARVQLGFRPQYATYLAEPGLLAVSLSLSQKVLLLDPVSLRTRGSLSTGSRPQGLVLADDQLYVAEQSDNTVSVFDMNSRSNRGRIAVGFGPSQLLYTGNEIFISHELDGTLAALLPGQLGVIREIPGLDRPWNMAYTAPFRRIYVVDRGSDGVAVVDVNASLLPQRIDLGAEAFGLAVLP